MSYSFKVNYSYSFSVHAAQLLGTGFTNVKVLGEVNYAVASSIADVAARHTEIYPLTPGMVDDPTKYNYLVVLTQDGIKSVLGVPWINEETVREITSLRAIATVENVTMEDLEKIRLCLVQNGYNDLSVVPDIVTTGGGV